MADFEYTGDGWDPEEEGRKAAENLKKFWGDVAGGANQFAQEYPTKPRDLAMDAGGNLAKFDWGQKASDFFNSIAGGANQFAQEYPTKQRDLAMDAGENLAKFGGGVRKGFYPPSESYGDEFRWNGDVGAMQYTPRYDYRASRAGQGEKLIPGERDYASSFAYGDYNYNPQGGFSYSPSPGYDGRVTGRDSQAYGDYNYNPPDWNQKPSDYNLPGDRQWPDEGRYTQQYQSNRPTYGGAPAGGVGAGGGQAPRTTAAAPRTAAPYAARYSSGGGKGGGSGFNYGGGGGGYNDQPQSVQAGLMNWRF